MERILTNLNRRWIDNIIEDIGTLAIVIRADEHVSDAAPLSLLPMLLLMVF